MTTLTQPGCESLAALSRHVSNFVGLRPSAGSLMSIGDGARLRLEVTTTPRPTLLERRVAGSFGALLFLNSLDAYAIAGIPIQWIAELLTILSRAIS